MFDRNTQLYLTQVNEGKHIFFSMIFRQFVLLQTFPVSIKLHVYYQTDTIVLDIQYLKPCLCTTHGSFKKKIHVVQLY